MMSHLSTRAIAPAVGVSPRMAAYDRAQGVQLLHTTDSNSDYSVSAPDYEDASKLSPIASKSKNAVTTTIKLTVRAEICYLI